MNNDLSIFIIQVKNANRMSRKEVAGSGEGPVSIPGPAAVHSQSPSKPIAQLTNQNQVRDTLFLLRHPPRHLRPWTRGGGFEGMGA